jgi:molybdopterin molybdotransferase
MDHSLEAALAQILAAVPSPVSESVLLDDALGRVPTERVLSPIDLPVFDNSSMDGYGVRAGDVAAATPDAPVRLRLAGKAPAGLTFHGQVGAGFCVRLATGSLLPEGADAVVMQEDTQTDSATPDAVLIFEPAKPWENIRRRGEDVRQGAALSQAGEVLTAGHLSLLAAAGIVRLNLGRQPVAALLATGSELKERGQPLQSGQIYESNRHALAALMCQAGALPRIFPIVADTLDATRAALEAAFAKADAVVTCGGASVGEMDFVKRALEGMGGELQFWRVAIKPGRPFVFGRWREKLLFGLPGNPVSAFVTFLLLVRPALLRWQGAASISLFAHPGVLAEALANPGPRRHFLRVTVDASGKTSSAGLQASHALSSLAAANGLLEIPPHTNLASGTTVQVSRWA